MKSPRFLQSFPPNPRDNQNPRDNLYYTLPTKVRLVKAMVFPVVVYGCESWTVKKAEH